jgi:hypothetical protein
MALARSAVVCQAGLIELDQDLFVNLFERFQIGHSHMFVNFVNGGVGWAKLNDLRADLGNEATVAGTTRSGQFGFNASDLQNGILNHVDQAARGSEEGQTPQGPFNVVFELVFIQNIG